MIVFIARDGVELGEFPGSELAKRARAGELLPTDYYWIEGMDSWLLLGDRLPPETWQLQDNKTPPPAAAPAPVPAPAKQTAPKAAAAPAPAAAPQVAAPEPEPEAETETETAPKTAAEAEDEFLPALPASPVIPIPIRLPGRRVTWLVGGIFAALIVLGLGAYFVFSGGDDPVNPPLRLQPAPPPAAPADTGINRADRDAAALDLKRRLEQLPSLATPPQNSFYFDLRVRMSPSARAGSQWTAVITGTENTVDPEANKPVRQTQFTLTADYRENAWTFIRYEAAVTDLLTLDQITVRHEQDSEAPPSLATILGLRVEPPR